MGTLLLFRHGETDLTYGRYCGSSDPPLNDGGRGQAQRIRDLLLREGVAAIYSSPLRRVIETAEPSARALGLEVRVVDGLREADFGEWEGLTFAQARERDPDTWRRREADPYSVAPPGGEAYRDLLARVVPAFGELFERHPDEAIAVFAHKSVNRVFMANVLMMPVAYYRRIEFDPGALAILRENDGRVEVLAVNESCHLGMSAGDRARRIADADTARRAAESGRLEG